jgi:hypothetical protein
LLISYNRIFKNTRGCEAIVKENSKYNNVTTIVENHAKKYEQKNNYGLEIFRLW